MSKATKVHLDFAHEVPHLTHGWKTYCRMRYKVMSVNMHEVTCKKCIRAYFMRAAAREKQ